MFQPARPPLRWSSVAKRRARSHGLLYVVDPVPIRPMRLVIPASAESTATGSNCVCGRCVTRYSGIAMLSARKIESMSPRSAIRAISA
jgi:hypothetical protein